MTLPTNKPTASVEPYSHCYNYRSRQGLEFLMQMTDRSLANDISFFSCYSCQTIEIYPMYMNEPQFRNEHGKNICSECLTKKEKLIGRKIEIVKYPVNITDFIRQQKVSCIFDNCQTELKIIEVDKHFNKQHFNKDFN